MGQEIRTFCDTCGPGMTGDDVMPVGLRVNKMERVVDLCAPCRKEHVDPIAELLKEHGRPVTALDDIKRASGKLSRMERKGSFLCPECGSTRPTSGKSLASHLSKAHEWDGARASVETDRQVTQQFGAGSVSCPDCPITVESGTGLSAHRRWAHRESWATERRAGKSASVSPIRRAASSKRSAPARANARKTTRGKSARKTTRKTTRRR